MRTLAGGPHDHRSLASAVFWSAVSWQSGFTTATAAPPTAATLSSPRSVWIDNTNTLVADTSNNRVLWWPKPITTVGQAADRAIGKPGLTHNQIGASPTLSASELAVVVQRARVFSQLRPHPPTPSATSPTFAVEVLF